MMYQLLLFTVFFYDSHAQGAVDVSFNGPSGVLLEGARGIFEQFDCYSPAAELPENVTLAFIKDGRIITRYDAFIDEELASHVSYFSWHEDRITLFLRSINREDSGYYECCAFDGDPLQNRRLVCEGELVEVKHTPVPICTPSGVALVNLGDHVILSCVSEGGDIPIDGLVWTNDNSINSTATSSEVVTRKDAYNVASDLTLRTSDMDINDVYTCEALYDQDIEFLSPYLSYLSRTRRCTISVSAIWPKLAVHPNEAFADLDGNATFTCNFPYLTNYTTSYEWTSKPPINQSRISTSDNVFRIMDVAKTDNGTIISCFALFEQRWFQSGDARLFVNGVSATQDPEMPSDKTVTTTSGSSGWKAAFSVVFVILIASIGVHIFLYLRQQTISKPSTDVPIADNKDSGLADQSYMDLKKPAKENDDTGYYMETIKKEDNREDDAYENEGLDVGEIQPNGDDSIYDYADTE